MLKSRARKFSVFDLLFKACVNGHAGGRGLVAWAIGCTRSTLAAILERDTGRRSPILAVAAVAAE
jgi:hypothetical protein